MRIRKLRVATAALTLGTGIACAGLLAPPAEPPVPSRTVADPQACVSAATLQAARDLSAGQPIVDHVHDYAVGDRPAAEIAGAIADAQAPIAALRQAASCDEVGWIEPGNAIHVWRLGQLAVVDARLRHARGDGAGALDELLDVWSVGRDLGQSGGIVGIHVDASLTMTAAEAIVDLAASPGWDPAALVDARHRIEALQQRPSDLSAAVDRESRLWWSHLPEDPPMVVSYARWQWARRFRFPALLDHPDAQHGEPRRGHEGIVQSAAVDRRRADERARLAIAALE